MSLLLLMVVSSSIDCRGEAPSSGSTTASASAALPVPSASAARTETKPQDGRELAATANFGDLIGVASAIQTGEKGASEAGCNLRRDKDGSYRFEAPLASDKIAAPPEDLDDALMKGSATIRLLTAYGLVGMSGDLILRPLSPLPKIVQSGLIPALFVTDRGVYLRVADSFGSKFGSDRAPIPESDIERVKAELAPRAQAVVVTAEAGVKLERLREVLSWVKDAKGPVVLATPLEKGAPIPKPIIATKGGGLGADGCPRGGLMDIPKGSKPGSYGDQQLFKVGDAYQKDLLRCSSSLAPGSAGGKVHIDMRIEPDGKVSKTCIEKDTTDDAALRKCVLDRTRAYPFPKPSTPGIVNYGTELSFTPPSFATKALCE